MAPKDKRAVKFAVSQRVKAKAGKLKGRKGTVKRIYISYAVQLDEDDDYNPVAFTEKELEPA